MIYSNFLKSSAHYVKSGASSDPSCRYRHVIHMPMSINDGTASYQATRAMCPFQINTLSIQTLKINVYDTDP